MKCAVSQSILPNKDGLCKFVECFVVVSSFNTKMFLKTFHIIVKLPKSIFIGILLFLFSQNLSAQVSLTYTFDSSVLSIIFTDRNLTEELSSFNFDMKDKWQYYKKDSVKIDIRGAYSSDDVDTVAKKIKLKYYVFGKKAVRQITTGSFEFSKTVHIKEIKRHPEIKIKAKKMIKEKSDTITIDSIDIGALLPEA